MIVAGKSLPCKDYTATDAILFFVPVVLLLTYAQTLTLAKAVLNLQELYQSTVPADGSLHEPV